MQEEIQVTKKPTELTLPAKRQPNYKLDIELRNQQPKNSEAANLQENPKS